jgi:hypothetical protein
MRTPFMFVMELEAGIKFACAFIYDNMPKVILNMIIELDM